jgi:serine/threonine protein kinase
MVSCKHGHILSVKGVHVSNRNTLLVYEYMPNGSLEGHMFSSFTGSTTESPILLDWPQR